MPDDGPREVFEAMKQRWLQGTTLDADLLAEDVVIESPFAPPGRAARVTGRDAVLERYGPERADFPARFDEIREIAVHDTADPEVIVVEYEMSGVVTTTGRRAEAPFIGVLRARDGKVVSWREYQNNLAIAAAIGRLPALVAAFGS